MKGVELPLNTVIIIAILLLVLLGALSLWMIGWGGQAPGIDVEAVKTKACAELIRRGCDTDPMLIGVNFDADQNGQAIPRISCDRSCGPGASCDNLRTLARCWFGCPDLTIVQCAKKLCGCPGYT